MVKNPIRPDDPGVRPRLEVADLFRDDRDQLGPLPTAASKVVQDIIDCRTAKLGAHVRRCDEGGCGYEETSYNSCRNRHCPKCQFLARADWVEARIDELLPVPYFHVVFTLPHELKALCLQNPKELYGLLFQAASRTLKDVTHTRLKNAEAGFIAVLHTWDQKLNAHPHLHVIVPGGGFKSGTGVPGSPDEKDRWISSPANYFLPVKVLAAVFRAKFLEGLQQLRPELKYEGRLAPLSDSRRFNKLLGETTRKKWVVYAKPPFAGPEAVIKYLGAYTHRIAISNYRLIRLENGQVVFSYRDSKSGNQRKQMSLPVVEFLRRFLLHVLPYRFVRIRHFGFLGNRFRHAKTLRVKACLAPHSGTAAAQPAQAPAAPEKPTWQERLHAHTGIDITLCPRCKKGRMQEIRVIESFYDRRRRDARQKPWDTS